MTSGHHLTGQRVRSIFNGREREGVVIESNPVSTLIEFQDYDEDEGVAFTHRKWLPTRHWQPTAAPPQQAASAAATNKASDQSRQEGK